MTDVINVYIYSIILQILMNMAVHVEAFKSGLVSRVTGHAERVSIKGQDVEVESRLLPLSKISCSAIAFVISQCSWLCIHGK